MKSRSPFLLVLALASCVSIAAPAFAEPPEAKAAAVSTSEPAMVSAAAPELRAAFVVAPCSSYVVSDVSSAVHIDSLSRMNIVPDGVQAAPRVRVSAAALTAALPLDSGRSRTIHARPPNSRTPLAPALPFRDVGLSLIGLSLMGLTAAVKTTTADKDTYPARDTVRQQHNLLMADLFYHTLNGVASTTIATAPLCARAGTASKVKTTNATVLREAGALVALAATDNFWTLTGGNLAAGSFRRYLLIDTAGVASVIASSDAATAAGCVFSQLPANGSAIVGILTIQNATNPFIPGTTLLSAAGVTDTYVDGTDGTSWLSAQVTP